jgi:hypothetical protein
MDINTVPVQTLVVVFGSLLSIIGVLIIFILTKIQNDVKDNKYSIVTLRNDMNKELDKKADKNLIEVRLGNIETGINELKTMIPIVNQVALDVAVTKGKEEVRREYSSK